MLMPHLLRSKRKPANRLAGTLVGDYRYLSGSKKEKRYVRVLLLPFYNLVKGMLLLTPYSTFSVDHQALCLTT